MTDKAAIRELRERVEKGGFIKVDEFRPAFDSLPPLNRSKHNAAHAYGAHNGSLDAALALHEAVLPGWVWELWPVNSQEYGCMVGNMAAVFSVTPARAWLIAILKAMEND